MRWDYFSLAITGFVLGFASMAWIADCSTSTIIGPYKRGQIEAQSGTIHWSLKDNPDGSREWKHD